MKDLFQTFNSNYDMIQIHEEKGPLLLNIEA